MPAAVGPYRPNNAGQLQQERQKALDRLESLRTYYDRPDAAQLLQQLQGQASGRDSPFTGDVVGSMLSQNADSGAGQVASDQDMIRQRMGNAGLGGSGLEASAMVTSRRRAAAQNRAGRREITSRAALENYQAKERAMGRVQQYLAERQQAESQAGMAEVDFRSKMQSVEDQGGQTYGNIETNDRNPMGMAGGGYADAAEPDDPFRPTWTEQTGGWDREPRAPGGMPVASGPPDMLSERFTGQQFTAPGSGSSTRPGGPNIDQALRMALPPTRPGSTQGIPRAPGSPAPRNSVTSADPPRVPQVPLQRQPIRRSR